MLSEIFRKQTIETNFLISPFFGRVMHTFQTAETGKHHFLSKVSQSAVLVSYATQRIDTIAHQ